MILACAPFIDQHTLIHPCDLEVVLFAHTQNPARGDVGAGIAEYWRRSGFVLPARAWDLLSIALSVVAADHGASRASSADGWTRELDLHIAVNDPDFWTSQTELIQEQLRFLTTDIWHCTFYEGGYLPAAPTVPHYAEQDCVALLSGGLDSLIGLLDKVARDGRTPYAVSQVSLGDKTKQQEFAQRMGGGLRHLQLNHNVRLPGTTEHSQRARSFIFLTYGALAAVTLERYRQNQEIDLFVCENGFISINPPLTPARVGSLSTRTTQPHFLGLFQRLLHHAGLRVRIENPYQFHTKGEMLIQCADQEFLLQHAAATTSCGRFGRMGYQHCGRCVPCIIRRAAFQAWGHIDHTPYKYHDLGLNDAAHAKFDDVRSMAMAVAQVRNEGLDSWLGACLNSRRLGDTLAYKQMIARGIDEIGTFLNSMGVA